MNNRLQNIFSNLQKENKKAFVSFSTAGFPDEESSLEIIKKIIDSGSHIHEISFPHAEAQADGPIIQLANIESLKNGITFDNVIEIAKKVRAYNNDVGLAMMGYLNNIFIYGIERFAKSISGIIDAVICVDLPDVVVEEKQLKDALQKEGIALIKLITPTTSEERIKELVKEADGFIYSVNVEGITGVKSAQIDKVNDQISKIKKYTDIPVVSGFGIKSVEDVEIFSKSNADGIVVGSAIIKNIQENMKASSDKQNVANFVGDFCKKLISHLNK